MRYVELPKPSSNVLSSEVRAIIEARLPGARFKPGSPVLVEEIDHECERIISENLQSQG